MGNIGMSELLLIFLVALLVFGAKRIPEIARGLGEGIREFKHAANEITREVVWEEDRTPGSHRISSRMVESDRAGLAISEKMDPAVVTAEPDQSLT